MSGSVIGALRVVLGMDSAAFETGAKKSQSTLSRLDKGVRNFGKGMQKFGDGVTAYGQTLSLFSAAITGAAAAAFGLAASAADAGDRVAKSARSAGVGAEYYQEMAFAMGQVTDLSQDELDKGLLTLSRRLGDAATGSKSAAAAFEAIGISQKDIASGSVTTEQAMDRLVAYLSESTDASTAAAVAADLFGKSGARMGAQMSGSAGEIAGLRDRAHELGIVMTDEALNASEAFGDKWSEVGTAVEGLKIKLANELLPILVDTLIPAILDTIIPAIGTLITKVGEWIHWFGELDPMIQQVVGWITAAFAVGGPVLLAIGAVSTIIGGLIAATGPVGLFIAAAGLLYAAWNQWGDDFKAAVGGAVDWVATKFDAFLIKLQSIIDKAVAVKTAITEAFTAGAKEWGSPDGTYGGAGGGGGSVIMGVVGADAAQGLVDGVNNGQRDAAGAGHDLAGALVDGTRRELDSHSPSRVMMAIGGDVADGLAIGIADNTAKPVNAITSAIGQMIGEISGFGDMSEGTFRRVGGWFADLAQGATTLGESLSRMVDSYAQQQQSLAVDAVGGVLSGSFGAVGGGLMTGLLGGLLGFQNGGSFQVGGVGGTDSQIVAFRASPNERVAVTKPGQFDGVAQAGQGGGTIQLHVQSDPAVIVKIAENTAGVAVKAGLKQVPSIMANHNKRVD